jgi:hypothetical protein
MFAVPGVRACWASKHTPPRPRHPQVPPSVYYTPCLSSRHPDLRAGLLLLLSATVQPLLLMWHLVKFHIPCASLARVRSLDIYSRGSPAWVPSAGPRDLSPNPPGCTAFSVPRSNLLLWDVDITTKFQGTQAVLESSLLEKDAFSFQTTDIITNSLHRPTGSLSAPRRVDRVVDAPPVARPWYG